MTRIQMTIYPKSDNTAKIKLIVETSSVLEAKQLCAEMARLIREHFPEADPPADPPAEWKDIPENVPEVGGF